MELACQVAQALGFAHERGVIHRDIKPQNVLLTSIDDVKVADFGIARAAAATTTASRLGLVLGTAGYMSPEQAKGDPVGPQSDLYSLGVILYEMLTGELPYDAEDPVALAGKHLNERPRLPSEVNPGVSGLLDGPTMRLLAKNPDERYASAVELVEDLERVRLDLPRYVTAGERSTGEVNAPPIPPLHPGQKETEIQPYLGPPVMEIFESGRRRRSMFSLVLAALLLGVILIVGIAYLWSQS